MWRLKWASGASQDLVELAQKDKLAAARLTVLLREIGDDPNVMEYLTDDGHDDEERGFDVVYLKQTRRTRLNLWRLKCTLNALDPLSGLVRHRVIYAVDWPDRVVWVMAIMPKPPEDYDETSPRFRRIAREYAQLCIPRLPGG